MGKLYIQSVLTLPDKEKRDQETLPPDGNGREVKAEVLTVDAKVLKSMDGLEGYPWFYRREVVDAALGDGTTIKAMVYVLNRLPERAAVIASGDWRNR